MAKERPLVARDLLNPNHPLHNTAKKLSTKNELTLRQARNFLKKYPQYRALVVKAAA